jgi:serine/threonine-protein kinase RsbW
MSEPTNPRCEFDRDDFVVRLEVTVPADVRSITPVVEEILALTRQLECGGGHQFEIETALREALANAIVHGCARDPGKSVQVCVGCDEARGMLIVVRDPGPGFDPQSIPSPVRGERLYAEHGRGIYLINQLMDEVEHRRGGTEIWMRKR